MPGKFIKKLSQKAVAPQPDEESKEDCSETKCENEANKESQSRHVVLDPLDLKKKPKKKRGKESRAMLKKKRENKHIVTIQSKWRGHCARKSIADQKSQKEAEKTKEPDEDNAEEEKLEDYKKIPFQDIRRVQFCVDNAVGLPVNCTATRVSCRLIRQDRTPLSEAGESYSDPESPVTSPDFDMYMTWKGNVF